MRRQKLNHDRWFMLQLKKKAESKAHSSLFLEFKKDGKYAPRIVPNKKAKKAKECCRKRVAV